MDRTKSATTPKKKALDAIEKCRKVRAEEHKNLRIEVGSLPPTCKHIVMGWDRPSVPQLKYAPIEPTNPPHTTPPDQPPHINTSSWLRYSTWKLIHPPNQIPHAHTHI